MGTTPLSEPAPMRVGTLQPEPQPSPSTAARKLLVIDDDEILSRFLHRLLVAHGFSVSTAADGISGLELLHSAPDLLVLDLNLPKMDGISVLQSVRAIHPQLPVLVLTARARSQSAVLALETGVAGREKSVTLARKAQAGRHRSRLMQAADRGEAFDIADGPARFDGPRGVLGDLV